MMKSKKTLNIGLMGSYQISDGYPNVKWLIRSMNNSHLANIVYGNTNVDNNSKKSKGLFSQSRKSKLKFLPILLRILISSMRSLFSCILLFHFKKIDVVYAPYPAHLSLFFLSFIPRTLRPPAIVDGFISLYDSAVLDRKIFKIGTVKSKLLFWFEKRALLSAKKVTVDTKCSAEHLSNLLGIPAEKFIHFPLMTDEKNYSSSKYSASNTNCINVLFVGTFVPLQGVNIIVKAANILQERQDIHFTIVGSGQTTSIVENILDQGKANITWLKSWQSPASINNLIQDSDICLGIFGKSKKAARVWPLKNYSYMFVGRAIISQNTKCIPYSENTSNQLFYPVQSNNPNELASAIEVMASSYNLRAKLAEASQRHYQEFLSNDKTFLKYITLFEESYH